MSFSSLFFDTCLVCGISIHGGKRNNVFITGINYVCLCFSLIRDYSGTNRRRLQKMLGYINGVLRSQRLTRGA